MLQRVKRQWSAMRLNIWFNAEASEEIVRPSFRACTAGCGKSVKTRKEKERELGRNEEKRPDLYGLGYMSRV